MLKLVLLVIFGLLLFSADALHLNHDSWDNTMGDLSRISDVLWNYCDFKCLYLETYYPEYDFVALIFSTK